MSNIYAMVNSSNIVVNVIIWDGVTPYNPQGYILINSDTANIGDIYDSSNGTFTPPK
jgi:hypothetical protein